MKSARFAKNIREVEAALGKSPPTLYAWSAQGCPCGRDNKKDGRYDLNAIRKWAEKNGRAVNWTTGRIVDDRRGRVSEDVATNGKPSVALVFKTAQAEEKRAKAALVQIELQQRSGEVHSLEECEEHTRRVHLYMRRTLLMLPRMGPTLAGKTALEIQAALAEKVEEIMRVFSGERDEF